VTGPGGLVGDGRLGLVVVVDGLVESLVEGPTDGQEDGRRRPASVDSAAFDEPGLGEFLQGPGGLLRSGGERPTGVEEALGEVEGLGRADGDDHVDEVAVGVEQRRRYVRASSASRRR
jgi:hypothetical protein